MPQVALWDVGAEPFVVAAAESIVEVVDGQSAG